MSTPIKYRKKPVVIEAMELDGGNVLPVVEWIRENGGRCHFGEHIVQEHGRNSYPFGGAQSVWIATLEGEMRADPGSVVIRGIQGEFYACAPDIFTATYEQVPA